MELSVPELRSRLESQQGFPPQRPHQDVLSELILGILSQNTSDKNSHPTYRRLRERFPSWEQVATAAEAEIALAIRSGGIFRTKAKHIKLLLEQIRQERGELSLDFLCPLAPAEALTYLQRLPGVGPKTARVVLLFSCGQPHFPVDTHIYRVTGRLGLLERGTSREQAHQVLEGLIPPQDYYPLHLLLIEHGRRICVARNPRCHLCALSSLCNYFLSGRKEAEQ